MPERACMRLQVNKATAAEKLKNASTVDSKIMGAMRPLLASKRSASSKTLLALGRAAPAALRLAKTLQRHAECHRAQPDAAHQQLLNQQFYKHYRHAAPVGCVLRATYL